MPHRLKHRHRPCHRTHEDKAANKMNRTAGQVIPGALATVTSLPLTSDTSGAENVAGDVVLSPAPVVE